MGAINFFKCDCCIHDCSFRVYSSTHNWFSFCCLLASDQGTPSYTSQWCSCPSNTYLVIDCPMLANLAYSSEADRIIIFFFHLDASSLSNHKFRQVSDLFLSQLKLLRRNRPLRWCLDSPSFQQGNATLNGWANGLSYL